MSEKETHAKELDDLLDSALEDFDKDNTNQSVTSDPKGINPTSEDDGWNQEFIQQQAKLFEEQMAMLITNEARDNMPSGEQLNLGFRKMAEAASMALKGDGLQNNDVQFVDSISEALKGLREGAENIVPPIAADDVAGMFAGLQMTDGAPDNDNNSFLPFMQGMMKSLLSAEVLLPSLKELLDKYPAWLAENGDKIDTNDKDRYEKQMELFKVLCADLEQEKPDDGPEVVNERFKKVLTNMQKLHEYGQPPMDLIGEGIPNLPDPSNFNDQSQCSVM